MKLMQMMQSSVLILVYFMLVVVAVVQLIAAMSAASVMEAVIRISIVLAIGLFFAVKIQRRLRKSDV